MSFILPVLPVLALLVGCSVSTGGSGATTGTVSATLSPVAELGERIFRDTSLSASGQMACSTCLRETFRR